MAVLGVLAAVAEAAPPPLPLVLPVPPLPRNSKIYFYEKLTKNEIDFFFLKNNYFLPVSEAVASVTEAVLAAAVEPAIAAIIKKIMYVKIDMYRYFFL